MTIPIPNMVPPQTTQNSSGEDKGRTLMENNPQAMQIEDIQSENNKRTYQQTEQRNSEDNTEMKTNQNTHLPETPPKKPYNVHHMRQTTKQLMDYINPNSTKNPTRN